MNQCDYQTRSVTAVTLHHSNSTILAFQLTAGSCELLQNATPEDVAVFNTQHVMQFLSIKQVGQHPAGSTPDRYRIIMSDGIQYMQAMLATQLNSMVQENAIGKNTVAVLEKLTCNYVQKKKCRLKCYVLKVITDASVDLLSFSGYASLLRMRKRLENRCR